MNTISLQSFKNELTKIAIPTTPAIIEVKTGLSAMPKQLSNSLKTSSVTVSKKSVARTPIVNKSIGIKK